MEVRQIPTGSGINGRPILHDVQPDARHLAYHWEGTWYTWCGERVPEDHRCPHESEIRQARPWRSTNCDRCHKLYTAGSSLGNPLTAANYPPWDTKAS